VRGGGDSDGRGDRRDRRRQRRCGGEAGRGRDLGQRRRRPARKRRGRRPSQGGPGSGDDRRVIDVHGGREHVIALKQNGTVWAWGMNNDGQLADGTKTNRPAPVQVKGLMKVIAVRTGHYSSFALKSDGTVWAWG